MAKMSRDKGKRGEREWASFCREQGYDADRTAQNRGKTGAAPDVEGPTGLHFEVKRVEALRIWDAVSQATRDAEASGEGNIPVVAWRKNNHDWLCVIRAEDFFTIYREWEASGCPLPKK